MQREFNRKLELLVRPHTMRLPALAPCCVEYHDWGDEAINVYSRGASQRSFVDVWAEIDVHKHIPIRKQTSIAGRMLSSPGGSERLSVGSDGSYASRGSLSS